MTEAAPPTAFFVSGGTVPLGAASYVARDADRALLEALRAGRYCYVLTSRQMGKSSLSVRTMEALKAEGVRTAFVDLTRVGGRNVTADQWYAGLLGEVGRGVGDRAAMMAYWKAHAELGPMQRFFGALREVGLGTLPSGGGQGGGATNNPGASDATPTPPQGEGTSDLSPQPPLQDEPLGEGEYRSRIVVFIDEIDATRSLPFSTDEFFAGIRECFNRRVEDPAMGRLTFCLIGVAIPSDLMSDAKLTPFNVGERIVLRDFTLGEAAALAAGLSGTLPLGGGQGGGMQAAQDLIGRVHHWTGGHPYLTQSLSRRLADAGARTASDVDRIVAEEFFGARARETNINLADVGNRVLNSYDDPDQVAKYRADVLSLYDSVRKGRKAPDDESNRLVAVLKLAGLVKAEGGLLKVRNRIYAQVFGVEWIREQMPNQELRRQRRAFRLGMLRAAAIGTVVCAALSGLGVAAALNARAAGRAELQARRAEGEATRGRNEAVAQRAQADTERKNAQAARREAEHQRDLARKAGDRATQSAEGLRKSLVVQEALARKASDAAHAAEVQRRLADLQRRNALLQKTFALGQRDLARQNAGEAGRQRALALRGQESLRAELYENAVEAASLQWEGNDRAATAASLDAVKDRKDRGWEWGYWNRLSRAEYTLQKLNAEWPVQTFVPSEGAAIIAYDEFSARTVDPETGRTIRELWRVPEPKDLDAWKRATIYNFSRTSFSANGRWAVRRDANGDFVMQDVLGGTSHPVALPKTGYQSFSISDDGHRVASIQSPTVGMDPANAPRLSLWDGRTGETVPFRAPAPPLAGTGTLTPDGRAFRVAYQNAAQGRFGMAEYDYTTGETRHVYALHVEGAPPAGSSLTITFVITRDGSVVVAHGARVGVFDPGRSEPRLLLNSRTERTRLSPSQDGRYLLTSNSPTRVIGRNEKADLNLLWDLRTGDLVAEVPDHGTLIGGDRIMLASHNGDLEGIDWRATLPYREVRINQPSSPPLPSDGSAARSFNTYHFRLLSNGTVVQERHWARPMAKSSNLISSIVSYNFYDPEGRLRGRYPETGELSLEADANLSLGDRWIISWSEKDGFQVRSVPDGRLVRTLTDFNTSWPDISRDGRRAADVDETGVLRIWEGGPRPVRSVPTGLSMVRFAGNDSTHAYVALSPDGERVLVKDQAHGYRIWDRSTLRRLASVVGTGFLNAEWSPSGRSLLLQRDHSALDRLDPSSGTATTILPRSSKFPIWAMSPDDRLLAVTVGGEVEIRAARTGRRLFALSTVRDPGPGTVPTPVIGLAFSDDGRRLYVLYYDGVLRTYDGGF